MKYTNIASYKFVNFSAARMLELKKLLIDSATSWGIRGTILLSPEGINLFVAGEDGNISQLRSLIAAQSEIGELSYKISYSDKIPFKRLLVKIKSEIIAFRQPGIEPGKKTAAYIEPEELKNWYDQGKEMIVLDTRNNYESRLGTFKNAIVFDIKNFVQFPEAVEELLAEHKDTPVVTFCTGGIRCEKAATYMEEVGFKNVYQLRDGILNYFEKVGSEHYDGDCFVFDQRVALDSQLQQTKASMCFDCRNPISEEEKAIWGEQCPYCSPDYAKEDKPSAFHAASS